MKWFTIILPMFLLGGFILLLTINNVYTETYDIERFNQAKETIRSPITIENEQETKRKIRETVQAVEDSYSTDPEIAEEQIEYTIEIFDALTKVEEEAEEVEEDGNEEENENEDEDEDLLSDLATDRDKVLRLEQLLSEEITDIINDQVFIDLIHLSPDDREQGSQLLIDTSADSTLR